MSFLWFACGAWPSTSRGVVRVSWIRPTKIKTTKISSEESGCISAKFRTSKNFPLYDKHSFSMQLSKLYCLNGSGSQQHWTYILGEEVMFINKLITSFGKKPLIPCMELYFRVYSHWEVYEPIKWWSVVSIIQKLNFFFWTNISEYYDRS